MINFEIKFISNEIEYTADVWKAPLVNNLPVQYHISNIQPVIKGVPEPFMFIHNPTNGIYECPIFEGNHELSNSMFNAIKKYCLENLIQLSK
jgi:hypothetical protein